MLARLGLVVLVIAAVGAGADTAQAQGPTQRVIICATVTCVRQVPVSAGAVVDTVHFPPSAPGGCRTTGAGAGGFVGSVGFSVGTQTAYLGSGSC
jgi:hypothetical protein